MDAFWIAVPAGMKLLIAVILGGTVHFLRNRALPLAEGLTGSITAMITGYLLMLGVSKVRVLDINEWWFLGALLTFLANYLLGGMENFGKQIRDSPVKTAIDAVVDAYSTIKEKFFKTP